MMDARSVLPAAILAVTMAFSIGPYTRAAEMCDDFSDGAVFDGHPIFWAKAVGSGELTPTAGCLEAVSHGDIEFVIGTKEIFVGDVSVRLRGSFNGTDRVQSSSGLYPFLATFVRADLGRGTYSGGVDVYGRVWIGKFAPGFNKVAETQLVVFDPYSTEDGQPVVIEIELAAIELLGPNVQLELRVWRQDNTRPVAPTLAWLDQGIIGGAPHTSGAAAWSVFTVSDSPVCIHSVCVTTTPPPTVFVRGDCNDDGTVDISDPVYALNYLFGGGPTPSCMRTADANDDNVVDIADPVYQLNHLFGGGPTLSAPVGECGEDPTPAANAEDNLSCDSYPPCEA